MTRQEFLSMADSGILLLDGATGSNLRRAGMPVGVSPEKWVLEHPAVLINLQRGYISAGSHIVYAPTFGGNRHNLRNYGLEDEIAELNAALVRLSKEVAEDRALVGGDISTLGKPLEPSGSMTYTKLYDIYCEQMSILAEAGADVLAVETMMGVEETCAALDAAQSVCDLAVLCTLSVEADGSALFDGNAVEAVAVLQEMGAAAVGVNCSVGPDQLEAVVAAMKAAAKVPVIAKPNAGMPVMTETGGAVYSMGPEDFAKHMQRLAEAGASVVGGCCGTTPEYIRQLKETLKPFLAVQQQKSGRPACPGT